MAETDLAQEPQRAPPELLVETKILVPPTRAELVSRRKLLELLSAGAARKLTLVDAPVGWGKTTLLADWCVAGAGRAVAWVSLDRGDNDPVRFWSYVVAALRAVGPTLGARLLAALRSPGAKPAEGTLASLVNELLALGEPVALVLDDYHVISSGDVHAGMEFLIDHCPVNLQLVLSARSDPPLPLARLRASGELAEVRAADLRFTDEDAAALLQGSFSLDLKTDDVARLQARTEGWAAGLYLAGLSLRGRPNAGALIDVFAGDDRHLVDYLASEVLDGLPADTRSFLLRTSILQRLSGPLCDAVLESEGSAEALEELERSNLLLEPLDSRREWYRYHQLFSELLHHELLHSEPELVPALHRRASRWFSEEGAAAEAIHHALRSGDFEFAADLTAAHWRAFTNAGRITTVGGWLDSLPAETRRRDPRLCLATAWLCYVLGRLPEVEPWLAAAERGTLPGPIADGFTSVDAEVATIRALTRLSSGDVASAIAAGRRAVALESRTPSPGDALANVALALGLFWSGEDLEARSLLENSVRIGQATRMTITVTIALSFLASIQLLDGDVRAAEERARAALEFAEATGTFPYAHRAMAHVALGSALEATGALADASAEIERGLETAERGGDRLEIAFARLALARVRHLLGNDGAARRLVRDARAAIRSCPDPGILGPMLRKAEAELRLGPPPGARDAFAGASPLSTRELAVLRLLPASLSLREISASLYVSLNTVKTHTRSIYRKLGASSRDEAVSRARELDLL